MPALCQDRTLQDGLTQAHGTCLYASGGPPCLAPAFGSIPQGGPGLPPAPPLKETTHKENLQRFTEDAGRAGPDPLAALITMQNLIDDYLEWFRTSLGESLADEISQQPDEEIFEFNRRQVDRLTNMIANSKSLEARIATRELLDEWQESNEFLALNVQPDFVLSASQRRRVSQWEKVMDALALPLPERPYLKSRASVQTPIHRELSSFIPAPPTEGQPAWTGQALPEYVQRNRSGFIDLPEDRGPFVEGEVGGDQDGARS